MVVKEVYDRIGDLEKNRDNFMRIQEFCLGHYTLPEEDEDVHIKIYGALEDGAMMNISLRELASRTIAYIDFEIARLKKLIENTYIKID